MLLRSRPSYTTEMLCLETAYDSERDRERDRERDNAPLPAPPQTHTRTHAHTGEADNGMHTGDADNGMHTASELEQENTSKDAQVVEEDSRPWQVVSLSHSLV